MSVDHAQVLVLALQGPDGQGQDRMLEHIGMVAAVIFMLVAQHASATITAWDAYLKPENT
jgi:hypothetical protein